MLAPLFRASGCRLQSVASLVLAMCFAFLGGCSLPTAEMVTDIRVQDVWRVGYYQGGDYHDYELHLRSLVNGLVSLKVLEPLPSDEWWDHEATGDVWAYLNQHAVSKRIEFVGDAFYDAQWDDALRVAKRRECLDRCKADGLDLVIAAGTWAGQDLATDQHDTPVLVISTSDPIRAGIIESAEDSGLDHVHAMCDPTRYERNLRTFHRLVGFERLGLVYEDTESGRIYGNVEVFRTVAAELGFEIVERHIADANVPVRDSAERLRQIYSEMTPDIDALILTALQAESPEFLPWVIEPLLDAKIPTWGQLGVAQVRRGALLSVSERDYDDVGRFYAETMVAIMDGALPRELPQVFEDPKTFAINMETARRIGYEVPGGLEKAASEVFETIDGDRH